MRPWLTIPSTPYSIASFNPPTSPGKVVKTESAVGGGSLPEETQPSRAVALDVPAASRAAAVLRAADPPVVARIVDDLVALDLRSVLPEDDGRLAAAVSRALAGQGRTE